MTGEAAERHHELKTWPASFQAIWDGDKTFEVRYDEDRGFQKGDRVGLREWDPSRQCECRETSRNHTDTCPRYTGRWLTAEIGYVLSGTPGRGAQHPFNGRGYVVFSLLLNGASDPELNTELST